MTEENQNKGKRTIENNGVSILKDLTEDDIKDIEYIENNGVMIVPQKLISRMASKNLENNGIMIPYIEGMRVYAGKTTISTSMLNALDEPIEIVQAGTMTFEEDVTPEQIKAKIKSIRNYGKILANDKIYGVVMAVCTENVGVVSKNNNHCEHHKHKHENDEE